MRQQRVKFDRKIISSVRRLCCKSWSTSLLIAALLLALISAKAEVPQNAIGYLMDLKGNVTVMREGAAANTRSSCSTLQREDVISIGDDSGATVLLPTRAYVIRAPGKYRIAEAEVVQVKSDGDVSVDPILGSRGNPLLDSGPGQLIMPPKALFAAVKPPIMRAGKKITVLSPSGLTLSTTPDLVWTGAKTNKYIVQVIPIDAGETAASLPAVRVTGCTLKWADSGWPAVTRGSPIRVMIVRQGQLLTDESHCFTIADDDLAAKTEQRFAAIEKDLPAGVARELIKASMLANPDYGFYAEARIIAVGLLKNDLGNPIYLKLMQRCYAGMGMAEGVVAVERRLAGELVEAEGQ